ncbi:hypothetical protein P0082_12100 [Candidatus Haliotispira prima]|uniref:Uncharacterized protein n=1 Tax=Candidatus Haliotispira prima TaxID=3034016 RepID=A0ABY8MGR0_9SPIO|nr:hypothetical protein P0082_12100 [Candidatus Haliotispira prima]
MDYMTNAPIVLFCYNRLRHLEQTLGALSENTLAGASVLYIYADGPKNDPEDRAMVEAVRQLVKRECWQQSFERIEIIEATENEGLAPTVIRGVSEVIARHGRVIVLEDDVLVNPYFLEFMNDSLHLYRDEEKLGSIRAQVFDLPNLPDLFFAQMNGDFAWATWQRVWEKVSFDGEKLLKQLQQGKLTRQFDYDNYYPYTQMLRDQIAGRNSSWGVRFYSSLFLQGMLTFYSGKALAVHIGYDGGTHFNGEAWSPMDGTLYSGRVSVRKLAVVESESVRQQMKQLFKQQGFASFRLLKRVLKTLLPVRALQLLRRRDKIRASTVW